MINTDITYCNNTKCALRNFCLRYYYNHKFDEADYISVASFEPFTDPYANVHCDMYVEKPDKK